VLHIPAVLAADLVEGVADLAEAALPYGVHELVEDVFAFQGRAFEVFERLGCALFVALLELP
jgi:hypothetical protein